MVGSADPVTGVCPSDADVLAGDGWAAGISGAAEVVADGVASTGVAGTGVVATGVTADDVWSDGVRSDGVLAGGAAATGVSTVGGAPKGMARGSALNGSWLDEARPGSRSSGEAGSRFTLAARCQLAAGS
ncbi:MAG: hypothetical protein FWD11_12545 [Micrococcales bacterium]|nr:hypothetical protein [Micrococcales bacterium]